MNAFQRRFGSVPMQITMSRFVPGSAAWKNSISGHEISRVSPSLSETRGRVCWKSM